MRLRDVVVGSGLLCVLVEGVAAASGPVPLYREVERARRCSGDGGTTTCSFEFTRTYSDGTVGLDLTIEGVGSAAPEIIVRDASRLVYPRYRVGSRCVEIASVFLPTAGISLSTGAFFRSYADCVSSESSDAGR